jgi:hypothetical protein
MKSKKNTSIDRFNRYSYNEGNIQDVKIRKEEQ